MNLQTVINIGNIIIVSKVKLVFAYIRQMAPAVAGARLSAVSSFRLRYDFMLGYSRCVDGGLWGAPIKIQSPRKKFTSPEIQQFFHQIYRGGFGPHNLQILFFKQSYDSIDKAVKIQQFTFSIILLLPTNANKITIACSQVQMNMEAFSI